MNSPILKPKTIAAMFSLFLIFAVAAHAFSIPEDEYEIDDTPDQANVIDLNGIPQTHNFHDIGDEDWVKFYAVANEAYEIVVDNVGEYADPVIELFDADGNPILENPWNFGFEGESERLSWKCPADGDGIYFVKIHQLDANVLGFNNDYDLAVFRPVGQVIAFLKGLVTNSVTGKPVANATIITSWNQSAITLPDGNYIMGHIAGTYSVTASAAGYLAKTETGVEVDEGSANTRNISLKPLDSDEDGMPDDWEEDNKLDPFTDDADEDPDGDGDTNLEEYKNGTNPRLNEKQLRSDLEAFVTRFYRLCLDREPDEEGLNGWVNALLSGTQTGSDVAFGFVFSPEFLEKNPSNEAYLMILYEAFFNRKPDAGGWAEWLRGLNEGNSRQHVLNGFIYAKEFNALCRSFQIMPNPIAAFVTRFYQLCLKRDPDLAGLDNWVLSLLFGENVGADVAKGFIFSPEFTQDIISDVDYLTILYKAFFNRDPDPAGLQSWLDAIKNGTTRDLVLDGFIYSQEFGELAQQFGITPFR